MTHNQHRSLARRWGKSTKGQDLLALELYAGGASEQHRPGFKYVGNLHGDEPSGRCVLLQG